MEGVMVTLVCYGTTQGISQRGKLLMMLGQCAEAAQDFQRVVQYVVLGFTIEKKAVSDDPN